MTPEEHATLRYGGPLARLASYRAEIEAQAKQTGADPKLLEERLEADLDRILGIPMTMRAQK